MADGFGRLAWLYESLERTVYGANLQRTRLALAGELVGARNILVLGEGDGRFLVALLTRFEAYRVTVLECSPGMISRTRVRLAQLPQATSERVTFWQADALTAPLPESRYDALVTNFFLDAFHETELPRLVARLAGCLEPGGLWLVSDFAPPPSVERGLPRLLSRVLLPVMYAFFQIAAGLTAKHLTPSQPFLAGAGLGRKERRTFLAGFLYAELWQKPHTDRGTIR